MITLPTSERESHRVDMVRSFGLLDLPRPPQHDEIALLAGELAGTRWALVTLVDAERVWFSGVAGYPGEDACRWTSFSTHVISSPGETTWIADAREDFRFRRAPSVTGEPRLRFFAGAPILVNGHAVGTVCAFDQAPRAFDPVIARSLSRLASVVAEDLAARHREQALRSALVASADALIECDDRGAITEWSEGAERLFGFSFAEALGRNIDIMVPPEQKAAHEQAFQTWLGAGGRRGGRMELSACRKDGSLVDLEVWMSVAHVRGVPHIHANIRDVSERTAQAAALRRATAEAEAASEAKTIFLTNMSHELRTPLNGVIGVVDLLSQTPQSDHQRELTTIIQGSSDQLRRLIGDILDLARIEAGQLSLDDAPISLVDLVRDIAAAAAVAAEEKGVALHTELASDLAAHVTGDALRLRQVLSNLVANAVKFTANGSVSIHLSHSGDLHRFEVRDTGIGFDAAQRDAIFARFQQADGTITRRFGGSGLGLAICNELVTAMGGELDCQSTKGMGATFWFIVSLPQVRAGDAGDAMSSPEEPPRPGQILIVDDNPTNRRVAELMLQTIGVEVTCVEDGAEAVDAFLVAGFDAILMDMMMPVMDGATATRTIRDIERRKNLARTPIIMLTANSLPEHIEASLAAGADLHLAKPVNPQALFEALARVHQSDRPKPRSAIEAA